MKSSVSVIQLKDYNFEDLLLGVNKSIELLGGIEKFIRPGSKVLLKPNLLSNYTPDQAVTTHPEFARAVIRILKKINCKIFLGDGPSVWVGNISDVESVYKTTGMTDVCREEGINLVRFDEAFFLDDIPITSWVKKCDCIVSLPKFKTHDLMTLTGAVKNLFGLIPGMFKAELHRRLPHTDDFAKVLIKIATEIKPALSIVDGILAMEGEGPGSAGTPRNLGMILAGSDMFAIDVVMAKIMGLEPKNIPTIRLANYQDKEIEIRGDVLDTRIKKFQLPAPSFMDKIPRILLPFVQQIFYFMVVANKPKCTFCKRCVKACPVSAITPNECQKNVHISQKKCIKCFCCREACPVNAIDVKNSFGFFILQKVFKLLK